MSTIDDLIVAKEALLSAEEALNIALNEYETLHLTARTAMVSLVSAQQDLKNEVTALNSDMSTGQKTAALATIQSRRNARSIEATALSNIEVSKQSKQKEIRTLREAYDVAQEEYDTILSNL